MNYNGENECFICGYDIRWQAQIYKPGITAHTVDGARSVAETVAIDLLPYNSPSKHVGHQ